MSLAVSTYEPNVPYQDSTSCSCGFNMKSTWMIVTALALAILVLGALELSNTITFPGDYFRVHAPYAPVLIGSLLTSLCIGGFVVLKRMYNDVYPNGNTRDFIKRDWSTFTGENYEHFENWYRAQSRQT